MFTKAMIWFVVLLLTLFSARPGALQAAQTGGDRPAVSTTQAPSGAPAGRSTVAGENETSMMTDF